MIDEHCAMSNRNSKNSQNYFPTFFPTSRSDLMDASQSTLAFAIFVIVIGPQVVRSDNPIDCYALHRYKLTFVTKPSVVKPST
jgi:hypothetical protein